MNRELGRWKVRTEKMGEGKPSFPSVHVVCVLRSRAPPDECDPWQQISGVLTHSSSETHLV